MWFIIIIIIIISSSSVVIISNAIYFSTSLRCNWFQVSPSQNPYFEIHGEYLSAS